MAVMLLLLVLRCLTLTEGSHVACKQSGVFGVFGVSVVHAIAAYCVVC